MIYLIYGQQSVMIKNRLNKIVKERLDFVDAMNFVKFDMNYALIQDVILEASYMPLGYEHKLIVAEDCYFLKKIKGKNKNDDKQDFASLISFLKQPNENCDLVLTLNDESVDEKSDLYKLIAEKGKIFQLLSVGKNDWNTYIYKYFNETLHIKIDNDAIVELANRINGDLNIFLNEANKLSLYDSHITYDDVCRLVSKPLDENAFEIFNHLMNKKNDEAIKIFKNLLVDGVEPVTLISMLGNQFRLLWQIAFLHKSSLTSQEIADKLKIKEVRVRILKKYMYMMTLDDLLETLDRLYNLDYQIKSGQIDRFIGFELFLINFQIK